MSPRSERLELLEQLRARLLDYVLTRPVSNIQSMRGIYVAYCHEDGSMKDDSILYKFAHDDYLLMPSDIDHSALS